jgi:hypothetical protein
MRIYAGRYKNILEMLAFRFTCSFLSSKRIRIRNTDSTYDKKRLDLLLKKVALSWPESSWKSRLLSRALSSRNSAAPPRSFTSFS